MIAVRSIDDARRASLSTINDRHRSNIAAARSRRHGIGRIRGIMAAEADRVRRVARHHEIFDATPNRLPI